MTHNNLSFTRPYYQIFVHLYFKNAVLNQIQDGVLGKVNRMLDESGNKSDLYAKGLPIRGDYGTGSGRWQKGCRLYILGSPHRS